MTCRVLVIEMGDSIRTSIEWLLAEPNALLTTLEDMLRE
jgi:hypothetical protein